MGLPFVIKNKTSPLHLTFPRSSKSSKKRRRCRADSTLTLQVSRPGASWGLGRWALGYQTQQGMGRQGLSHGRLSRLLLHLPPQPRAWVWREKWTRGPPWRRKGGGASFLCEVRWLLPNPPGSTGPRPLVTALREGGDTKVELALWVTSWLGVRTMSQAELLKGRRAWDPGWYQASSLPGGVNAPCAEAIRRWGRDRVGTWEQEGRCGGGKEGKGSRAAGGEARARWPGQQQERLRRGPLGKYRQS